jgi:Uncharacterized conserved protein
MKIAIPVLDNDMHKYDIANGFNSTGSLCLYNNREDKFLWMHTSDLASNMGELLPALVSKQVNTIITNHIHPMALKVLVNKGFKVYKSSGHNLLDNLNLFKEEKLDIYDILLSYSDVELCGGECSACSSDCDQK